MQLSGAGVLSEPLLQTSWRRYPPDFLPRPPSEGPSLDQDHSVFQQNKKIMKRVKSEVWHHFIVSPVDQLKALCRYCPCVISRGKRGDFGTSCLMRHLMRRHPDVLKNQKSTDERESSSPHPYTSLSGADGVSTKETDSPSIEKKPQTLPAFSKKTSKLWNHFSISPTDPTKVVCLHCSRTISRGKRLQTSAQAASSDTCRGFMDTFLKVTMLSQVMCRLLQFTLNKSSWTRQFTKRNRPVKGLMNTTRLPKNHQTYRRNARTGSSAISYGGECWTEQTTRVPPASVFSTTFFLLYQHCHTRHVRKSEGCRADPPERGWGGCRPLHN